MVWNDNFRQLVAEEQDAFRQKQAAFETYQAAKKKASQLLQTQQESWEERKRAKAIMDQEYASLKAARLQNDAIWEEYRRVRNYNNQRISILKPQADEMYRKMSAAFERASSEYIYGSKANAAAYSAEGKEYKEQLKLLNSEVSSLAQAVTSAKQYAKSRSISVSDSAFLAAQREYKRVKAIHETAERAFQEAKSERDRLHSEFKSLHQLHLSKKAAVQKAKKERQNRQAAVQSQNQDLMSRAGVPALYQRDCKVVTETDGTVNFYFGGIGEEDGLWHGHISMDTSGHVTYIRMPAEEHGAENFTDDPALNDFSQPLSPDKKWDHVIRGWIDDGTAPHAVTVQTGAEGKGREDETLISDGFVPDDAFSKYERDPEKKTHNHYGPNRIPGRSGRIEDPENGGDRGRYTGPGR